jgi:endonuclease YncB( thermonuclease family)
MRLRIHWLAATALLLAASTARGEFLFGPAEVVDGDTIRVGETTVRLFGIDAAEGQQECNAAGGGPWPCGVAAADRLRAFASLGPVACDGDEWDDFGRLLALCDAYDGVPINAALVAEGLAWAFVRYSTLFVEEETTARAAAIGVWQAPTIPPWEYRAAIIDDAIANQPRPPTDCPIKGNINRDGEQIYHLPDAPTYEDTVIRTEDGERWFCSEQEAIDAGWRAPRGP